MSESMVERVARAISPNIGWENPSQDWMLRARNMARDAARAAISAMREPTEAMRIIADEQSGTIAIAECTWPDMIDAALVEPIALPSDPSDCEDGAVTQHALDAALVGRGQRRGSK